MRMQTLLRGVTLLAVFLMMVWGADVNGKWKAEYEAPDGQTRTSLFTFQVEGSKLTGSVGGARGETPITDGKVSGDEISFSVTRKFGDNEMKFVYKGKVAGSEIKFTVTVGEGDRTFEMTAKKAN